MGPYTFGITVSQAAVEALVLTEVESLLLQLPFSIPVCLGDKKEVGVARF